VFEYYPGLGLQLQVNGTFSAAAALLRQGTPEAVASAARTLDEMRSLVAPRGGALTWEYEFPFGGAQRPWTSALAQATAVEAYTRAAGVLHRSDYLDFARQLSVLFEHRPPAGVRLTLPGSSWYLLYSFPPHQLVLNAHLDAVLALHDLAHSTGDPTVARLERDGLRAARHHIGRFDTGRWSRYAQGGGEASLNYHVLNLELAQAVCQRTGDRAICRAARDFARQLNQRCPLRGGARTPARRRPPGSGPTGASGPAGATGASGPTGAQGGGEPGSGSLPPGSGLPLPPIPAPAGRH
jgi:hypothetical protein